MANLTLDQAINKLAKEFPFPGYFDIGFGAHRSLAEKISARVPKGAKVLDIGCGPSDKTAVLSYIGYDCTGIDDFMDPWHREGDNLNKIKTFAKSAGITLIEGDGKSLPFDKGSFDVVMLCDVIEHLHASPKGLLAAALDLLKDDGWLVISVPNAVNLRKRIHVVLGKTNYPPYGQFFHTQGAWRGHVREYVWDDLSQLARYLGVTDAKIDGCHHMLGVLPNWAQPVYKLVTAPLPGARDSLVLCGRKPRGWTLPQAPRGAADGGFVR
jgi:SAM-dependent methyltransferase